jgi:hypothetical protein
MRSTEVHHPTIDLTVRLLRCLITETKPKPDREAATEIGLSVLRPPPMEPLKDNKPWRRALSIALGLAYVVWMMVAISKGHVAAGRHGGLRFSAARNPAEFWLTVGVILGLGVWLIIRGIRGRR